MGVGKVLKMVSGGDPKGCSGNSHLLVTGNEKKIDTPAAQSQPDCYWYAIQSQPRKTELYQLPLTIRGNKKGGNMAEIRIDIICEKCRKNLIAVFYRGQLFVEPCEVCMDRANVQGLDEGYGRGIENGKEAKK